MTAREAQSNATAARVSARVRDYFALTKPKVVSLIMFTAIVGMFLAVPGFPPAAGLFWGTIGIALAAFGWPGSPLDAATILEREREGGGGLWTRPRARQRDVAK